nr:putative ribonuclease H-like domain-containing protein [Tanacetum cinerariifolium]
MTRDCSHLINFVQKFLGTVKFGNDHVAKIMGYGDYQIGNVIISRVYHVEGLGHNLFSIRQFCDSDLKVAFRQHTCFIRNLDGVDLLTGSRGNNLYTLSLQDMLASSPICLLSKASKTKSWLWHPCAMGKSTKKTHKPKSEDTNQEKLYLLHMDLCEPIKVKSVNGKKYILVIVDDYSRFTWVKFLRSKDETSMFIIKFLKMIQHVPWARAPRKLTNPNLKTPTKKKLYLLHMDLCGPMRIESINGKKYILVIMDDYSRFNWVKFLRSKDETPMFIIEFLKMIQQNGVVERRNRTLIEAARTMLIYAQAPLFLWAEAVATVCFTQNRSIIRLRHGKTPYELMHVNDISSTVNHNAYMASSSAPLIDYAPMVHHSSEFSSPETGLVVSVFQKGDDPIDAINHMMSFLTAVVTLRVTIQPIQGRQNFMSVGSSNRLHRDQVEHQEKKADDLDAYDSDCDELNSTKIALMANLSHYGSDNLAENLNLPALHDDLILSAIEQLKTQVVNCTKINQDNKQVNELLTAELERYRNQERVLKQQKNDEKASKSYEPSLEIETLKHTLELALEKQVKELNNIVFKRNQSAQTAQQLKPNLYDGSVIEKSDAIVIPDTEETLLLAEESRSKMIEKQNDPKMTEKKTELSAEQAFWSQYLVQTDGPNLSATTTIVEVLKELLKVSMQMELAVAQHCEEKHKFQNKMENILQENDRLLTQALSVDIVNLVLNDNVNVDCLNVDVLILKLKEKLHSLNGDVNERNVKREVEEIETLNIELDHKVTTLVAENEHLKQIYKQLKSLGDNSSQRIVKQAQRQSVPKLRKNRIGHTDYIRHTQEEAATLREIIKSERLLSPLNTSLDYALTPKNKTKQIRLTEQITKSGKTTVTIPPSANIDSNTRVLFSTGVTLVFSASGSMSQDNTKKNRIRRTQRKAKKNKLEDHLRTVKSSLNKKSVVDSKATSSVTNSVSNTNSDLKCASCNGCLFFDNHDACVVAYINFVNASIKSKSVKRPKFLGTVKFGNDHVAKIMGYGDYQIGNVIISRVYYVEGLGNNLFSVGQFYDSDLEVAFRQHTCFIRNLDGVDLLTGSWGNNLYTLSLQDMMASSPICLLSKASKTKSWLWHRRLSHLNFGAINNLARQGLVRGLLKLKLEIDHLCSACAMGKIHADSTGSPSSTTVDQDAPSLSKTHTTTEIQSLVIPQDVGDNNLDMEVTHTGNDPLVGVP